MPYCRYIEITREASKPLPPTIYWEHDDAPLTPLHKPVDASKVAILGSSGVHMKDDPPFGNANDTSLRYIHRSTRETEIVLSHPAPINSPGKQDINVVFPLQRFRELEERGVIGGLADEHPSIIGTIWDKEAVENEVGPAIARNLEEQGVDLLCLFPL